jgi:acetyl-CoA C-acetyltransferase
MTALQAVRYLHQTNTKIEDLASIAIRLRGNGMRNEHAHLRKPLTHEDVFNSPVLAYPLRLSMVCPRSSGACAVVMSDAEGAPSDDVAWVRGIAARTNTYFMGDKMGDCGPNDHGRQYETRIAAEDAYRQAGITDPARQVHVAEPYVPFVTQEPMTIESLRLCEPGESVRLSEKGAWDFHGRLPVSPSGGVLCTNPISVSGMLRIAEAAQQVRQRAGDHQVERAETAVGAGQGGSIQFSVVAVLGTTKSLSDANA